MSYINIGHNNYINLNTALRIVLPREKDESAEALIQMPYHNHDDDTTWHRVQSSDIARLRKWVSSQEV